MNAQERPTIQQLRNAYHAEMKNILTNKRSTTRHIAKGNGLQKRQLYRNQKSLLHLDLHPSARKSSWNEPTIRHQQRRLYRRIRRRSHTIRSHDSRLDMGWRFDRS